MRAAFTRGWNCLAPRGERPTLVFERRVRDLMKKMRSATDNRAAQLSLTLTLSPRGAREPDWNRSKYVSKMTL
jgi:hypothetical protein